jgi:signal transduction histidine kinase
LPYLRTESVQSIVPHGEKYLVLGLTEGLVLFNHKSGAAFHLTELDGLPSNQFVIDQGVVDDDGNIWLLTEKGPVGVDVDKIISELPGNIPRPYVRQVWANTAPVFSGESQVVLEGKRFSHFQNSLRFRLANIGYDHPMATFISARLVGIDSTWNRIPNGESVAFNNLTSGDYVLEYFSTDKNGRRGAIQEAKFSIAPIFYKQPWFIPAMFALMLLTGFLISRRLEREKLIKAEEANIDQRVEMEKQQLKIDKKEAVERVRKKFMKGMHDFISGDLGAIIAMTSTNQYLRKQGNEVAIDVGEIEAFAKVALTNTNRMITVFAPGGAEDKSPVPDLVGMIRARAKAYRLKATIDVADNLPELGYSAYDVYNIESVFQEGIHNVHKHARNASQVVFKVSIKALDAPMLLLELSDDGPGIEYARRHASAPGRGHGLENMEDTAKDLGGTVRLIQLEPNGTKLQLSIPLKEFTIIEV